MTTNLINGKKYIGQKTSTTFLGNKYLGSGNALVNAIKKYGYKNFEVVMLESCNSRHELNVREAYYIAKYDAVHNDEFYNLKEGGHGGSIKGYFHHSESHKAYMSQRMSGNRNPNFGSHTNHWTVESRYRASQTCSGSNNPNFGNHCSEHTKQLISDKAKGRTWINNGVICKHVAPADLNAFLSNGWQKGRLPYSSTTIESVN